ncbi:unnamed protein product [Protopolystoma xenopodis]|uniref:Uncharacterized protein n=1 Tax=Protopolystoma xenopodis TaxID=117903 RepID=A0A448XIT1_9PLAT|nr:unnamed protein product [Protopolystoma xenopodis]
MGQVHCRAHDNQSLVDILKDSGADFTDDTERAFRLLDRGTYCDPEDNFDIYCDVAFRRRYLHLSAPSIYASAIYHLDLRPGQSFLNIGSGTGYLSTIAGLLLGPNGINHGIEHIVSNVSFARNQLNNFLTNSDAPYEREFCVPYFITGNIFNLVPPAGNISVKENDPGDTENDNDDETDLDNILITFHHHFDSIVPALVNGVPQIRMNEATTGSEDETEINTLEPKEDEQIENELTKDTPKRDNSLCDSFNRIADNQRNSLDERFAPNSSDNSENQTTDEEHYEIVNLPGSSILPRIMEVEPPPLLRPRSHQTENSLLNCDSDAEAVEFWLTYDRIYVGAGLTTNAQLLALLRLLRVGGRMFMAISRVSNNEFTSQYLLPTSFMPIVMPHPNSLPTYITPRKSPTCLFSFDICAHRTGS